jgi:hypothetical protein
VSQHVRLDLGQKGRRMSGPRRGRLTGEPRKRAMYSIATLGGRPFTSCLMLWAVAA